jgi:hypothetical protein
LSVNGKQLFGPQHQANFAASLGHPPAVTTSLALSLRPDSNSSLTLFGAAIAITAVLVLLQHAARWFVACRLRDQCRATNSTESPRD